MKWNSKYCLPVWRFFFKYSVLCMVPWFKGFINLLTPQIAIFVSYVALLHAQNMFTHTSSCVLHCIFCMSSLGHSHFCKMHMPLVALATLLPWPDPLVVSSGPPAGVGVTRVVGGLAAPPTPVVGKAISSNAYSIEYFDKHKQVQFFCFRLFFFLNLL